MYRQQGRRDPWPTKLEILGEEYLITHAVAFRCGETEDLRDILLVMEGMLLSGAPNSSAAVRLAQRIVARTHGSDTASRPTQVRSIDRSQYDDLIELSQADETQPVKGVARSATFSIAQDALKPRDS